MCCSVLAPAFHYVRMWIHTHKHAGKTLRRTLMLSETGIVTCANGVVRDWQRLMLSQLLAELGKRDLSAIGTPLTATSVGRLWPFFSDRTTWQRRCGTLLGSLVA